MRSEGIVIRNTLMKVMIVDDELLAIEDLRTLIPWDQHGFDIVATATNGKKALELYERSKPNLIILDVRMPVMDGIEFLNELHHSLDQRHVFVILLTAYKDFAYAQKAIEFRVMSYLLKHMIDESSLLHEVLKARSEWLRTLEQNRMIQSKMIADFIDGHSAVERNGVLRLPFAFSKIGFIVLQEDRPYLVDKEEAQTASDRVPISEVVQSVWQHAQPPLAHVEGIDLHDGDCTLVVFFDGLYSRKLLLETLHQLAVQCLDRYRQSLSRTLSSVITFSEQVDASSLQKIHKELKRAAKYKWFVGKNQIMDYDDLRNYIPRAKDERVSSLERSLESFLNQYDRMEIDEIKGRIAALFQELRRSIWSLSSLRTVTNGLLHALQAYDVQHERPPFNATMYWYGIDDIESGLITLYEQDYHQKNVRKNEGFSYKTMQAIDYIRKHYMDDLSVSDVSEAINISPSYLHQLFKSEVKKTFLEFVTEYRVQVAKDLLENHDYKIYEIAELTGYNTSQYFSQVFQKMTGMTPHAYKKKVSKKTHRKYQLQNIISL